MNNAVKKSKVAHSIFDNIVSISCLSASIIKRIAPNNAVQPKDIRSKTKSFINFEIFLNSSITLYHLT